MPIRTIVPVTLVPRCQKQQRIRTRHCPSIGCTFADLCCLFMCRQRPDVVTSKAMWQKAEENTEALREAFEAAAERAAEEAELATAEAIAQAERGYRGGRRTLLPQKS